MTNYHEWMIFDDRVLNGLGVMAAVVRSGSFAAAGESLNMSQSGVSRSIARLEARLGVRVLERTTRTVTLSEEGRRLYEQIVPLLAGLEEAAASVATSKDVVRGTLRVNMDPFIAQLIIGPQLSRFLKRFPELKLELISRDRLGDLVAEGFDLAIRFGEPRPSTLVARRLLDTRVVTVASPAYLKKTGRPIHPSELKEGNHRLIDFRDPETGRAFEWIFRQGRKEIEISSNAQLLLSDVATIHAVCIAGYGIAQLLELGIESLIESGRLEVIFPEWLDERFALYALHPSRNYLPPKTRAFLDFVIATVSKSSQRLGRELSLVR
jgi:DNA-binding transcriptional LysR family regulator